MKRKSFLTSILIVLFSFNGISQKITANTFCRHYEGKVCDKTVSFDLIKTYDSLTAESFDAQGMHIFLEGRMLDSNQFFLWENNYGKYHCQFSSSESITGIWESYNRTTNCKVELKESYLFGTMPFYFSYTKDSIRSGEKCPIMNYSLSLCTPGNYPNAAIADSVNRNIIFKFFNIDAAQHINAENYLYLYLMDFKFPSYYKTLCQTGTSSKLFYSKSVVPVYNENYILCLSYTNQTNVSAYPIDREFFYQVFNLKNGKLLALKDLFKSDFNALLKKRINDKLRVQLLLPDQFDMKIAGFNCNELNLTNNFYLNNQGIGFVYNPYEIGNYVLGNIDLFFYFNELSDIIDNKSIIQILINK